MLKLALVSVTLAIFAAEILCQEDSKLDIKENRLDASLEDKTTTESYLQAGNPGGGEVFQLYVDDSKKSNVNTDLEKSDTSLNSILQSSERQFGNDRRIDFDMDMAYDSRTRPANRDDLDQRVGFNRGSRQQASSNAWGIEQLSSQNDNKNRWRRDLKEQMPIGELILKDLGSSKFKNNEKEMVIHKRDSKVGNAGGGLPRWTRGLSKKKPGWGSYRPGAYIQEPKRQKRDTWQSVVYTHTNPNEDITDQMLRKNFGLINKITKRQRRSLTRENVNRNTMQQPVYSLDNNSNIRLKSSDRLQNELRPLNRNPQGQGDNNIKVCWRVVGYDVYYCSVCPTVCTREGRTYVLRD